MGQNEAPDAFMIQYVWLDIDRVQREDRVAEDC